jgi:hypothetical protein
MKHIGIGTGTIPLNFGIYPTFFVLNLFILISMNGLFFPSFANKLIWLVIYIQGNRTIGTFVAVPMPTLAKNNNSTHIHKSPDEWRHCAAQRREKDVERQKLPLPV